MKDNKVGALRLIVVATIIVIALWDGEPARHEAGTAAPQFLARSMASGTLAR